MSATSLRSSLEGGGLFVGRPSSIGAGYVRFDEFGDLFDPKYGALMDGRNCVTAGSRSQTAVITTGRASPETGSANSDCFCKVCEVSAPLCTSSSQSFR